MARRSLTLDAEQRRELEAIRDHDARPYMRERAAALLKVADGLSPHWVAHFGLLKERDPDTLYHWLDSYLEAGRIVARPPCRRRFSP
jgi:hypothetical protein